MGTGGHLIHGLGVAVDARYLRSGGARAAAVVAADAAFSQLLAEHTAVVPEVPPYHPGGAQDRLRVLLVPVGTVHQLAGVHARTAGANARRSHPAGLSRSAQVQPGRSRL